jgi:endonuclease YncB( thermonuclease family)
MATKRHYFGEVIKVIDGDTVDLRIRVDLGFNITTEFVQRVNVKDFDAPEIFRSKTDKELEHGRAAKQLAEDIFLNQQVEVFTYKGKSSGRYQATITLMDGRSWANEMDKAGMRKRSPKEYGEQ